MVEDQATPSPAALGAFWEGRSTRFRILSEAAERIELCLFEQPGDGEASARFQLEREGDAWCLELAGVRPGQLYGYRADGPFVPEEGLLFNPAKLLVDPYARALAGRLSWDEDLSDHVKGAGACRKPRDTASLVPKSVVVDPRFDWQEDRPPQIPWSETLIYEAHVKGLTQLHSLIPPELRGTYLALAQEPIIDHLRQLGVSAIQLMPVHHFVSERHLAENSLSNYWGYNTIGFFAPHGGFATSDQGAQVLEFKRMVRDLHAAGFEVLLDVVYNHTAESDHLGPTLCWRGLDNAVYYDLHADDPPCYVNTTGCGNTLKIAHPRVLQMVRDSMRYWVEEMHVDGFRFDLAPVLGRDPVDFNPRARFFEEIQHDPVLSQVKLIAEPWDVGRNGYRLGQFPDGWAEWNDQYRDAARGFWRGDSGRTGELATSLAGSRDLFSGRSPRASVNFVACHDGFTLEDLVCYEHKHNQANQEGNRDGHQHNLSRNWGTEGTTTSDSILELRDFVKRGLLATLAMSWGVPMLGHGDELGRTQQGNNNAYCQDNEITWVDWGLDPRRQRFLDFTRRLFKWRSRHADLWRGDFPGPERLTWRLPDGSEITPDEWQNPKQHRLVAWIHPTESANQSLLLLFNGSDERHAFHLPAGNPWHLVFDTSNDQQTETTVNTPLWIAAHSMAVLERREEAP